jgi:LysM repeat protein/uncharacterized protein YvpB
MQRAQHASSTNVSTPGSSQAGAATAVGASYAFDPAIDGMAGIYAARVLERGIDPRALCAEVRADRLGVADRGALLRAKARSRMTRFGRGTAAHLHTASVDRLANEGTETTARRRRPVTRPARERRSWEGRWGRRLAAAGLGVLLLLPLGVIAAHAQEAPLQSRYIVQEGDTLEGVAAEFGVDPAAILAASAPVAPPQLTPGEIIVIPAPGESPDEAAWNAAQREGTSPFVVSADDVAPGETLAGVASTYGLDPWALAAFNGIDDIDTLSAGQRLRIPLTDAITTPADGDVAESASVETQEAAADAWMPEAEPVLDAVGGVDGTWEEAASGPVFAADVPAYMQAYSLSCEYAAAYIATSTFGWGVPESAFIERIGPSLNPHWGYRGSLYGAWGGTDDYGVYPEALVPTLNEFGYIGDVFYSGGDASALTARLDAGMPVLTWLGYFGDTGWMQEDEGSYLVAPGMHVVVAYGYDDGGVYVSNPGRGIHNYYAWGDFLAMWSVLDGMALGVAPMG